MTLGRQRPGPVTDLAGATHEPFRLSERFIREARNRLFVQAPPAEELRRIDLSRRIEGIPLDVLVFLDALTMLAERGNVLAERLVWDERRKWGIDVRRHF